MKNLTVSELVSSMMATRLNKGDLKNILLRVAKKTNTVINDIDNLSKGDLINYGQYLRENYEELNNLTVPNLVSSMKMSLKKSELIQILDVLLKKTDTVLIGKSNMKKAAIIKYGSYLAEKYQLKRNGCDYATILKYFELKDKIKSLQTEEKDNSKEIEELGNQLNYILANNRIQNFELTQESILKIQSHVNDIKNVLPVMQINRDLIYLSDRAITYFENYVPFLLNRFNYAVMTNEEIKENLIKLLDRMMGILKNMLKLKELNAAK